MTAPVNIQPLYEQVRLVLDSAQQQVRHTINDVMVQTYWHVGRLIVEFFHFSAREYVLSVLRN